jgi:hypothetical protein
MVVALLAVQCRGGGDARRPGSPVDPADPGPGEPAQTCIDDDSDGFGALCAAGADCDDDDASIHEGCVHCGANPQADCPCDAAEPVECHSGAPQPDEHGRLRCMVGDRSCVAGAWGECVFTDSYPVDSPAGGMRTATGPPVACGNCDPGCYAVGGSIVAGDVGAGNTDDAFFDPAALPAPGGVVIDPNAINSGPYAYIAMPEFASATTQGAVAKVRTTDGLEVARYFVGLDATNNSSSRTAIDGFGNAYVANRAQGDWGSMTKIAGTTAFCNNGAASTSIDSTALAFGMDDCVLWTTTLPDPVLFPAGQDSIPRGVAIDRGDAGAPEGYVWASTFNDGENVANPGGRVYKLHPTTGAILSSIQIPVNIYGAVADAANPQRIWFSSTQTGTIAAVRVDTEVVETHTSPLGVGRGYGVTYDGLRIWQAAQGSWYARGYDPIADTWCYVNVGGSGGKGIAVRLNGGGTRTVYMGRGARMYYWDPDAPCISDSLVGYNGGALAASIALGGFTGPPIGVGIANDNRVLAIMRGSGNIAVYDPDDVPAGLLTYPTTSTVPSPYTYSDFTGYARAVFTNAQGRFWLDYGVSTASCAQGQVPIWGDTSWTASTPPATRIQFFASTAPTAVGLAAATPVLLGEAPTDVAPLYVDAALDAAGEARNDFFLRITAVLISDDRIASPVLQSMRQDWVCVDAS